MGVISAESDEWIAVVYGSLALGFVARRHGRFTALTINEESLGEFDDEATAVTALFRANSKRSPR